MQQCLAQKHRLQHACCVQWPTYLEQQRVGLEPATPSFTRPPSSDADVLAGRRLPSSGDLRTQVGERTVGIRRFSYFAHFSPMCLPRVEAGKQTFRSSARIDAAGFTPASVHAKRCCLRRLAGLCGLHCNLRFPAGCPTTGCMRNKTQRRAHNAKRASLLTTIVL